MSKELYEQALADVKKVTAVAEDNAKRAILEAVTPRIRELIESELLSEEPVRVRPGDEEEDVLLGAPAEADPAMAAAITPPDEEGQVTLSLDDLKTGCPGEPVGRPQFGEPRPIAADEETYVISLESLEHLRPLLEVKKPKDGKDLERGLKVLGEALNEIVSSDATLLEAEGFGEQIAQMISRVENMYDYVQESVDDPKAKKSYEERLETNFQVLNRLQELAMTKTLKDLLREQGEDELDMDVEPEGGEAAGEEPAEVGGDELELTIQIPGLSDADVDLDAATVELGVGAGEEEPEFGAEEPGGEEMDLGGLEGLGGEEEEEEVPMEVTRLSDDTIVEIDENMLRREIARMKRLRESKEGSHDGDKKVGELGTPMSGDEYDDFGGGSDDGEAFLDGEVTTGGAEPLGEVDGLDEDEMIDGDDAGPPMEAVQKRLAFEKRLQERARKRAASLKKEAKGASGRKLQRIKEEYSKVQRRFNESVARAKKFSGQLAEARDGARSNSGSPRSADVTVSTLRKKLAEENLRSTKLAYANRVLQSDLTKRQKAALIEQLDDAKTVREAKLVYESLVKALGGGTRKNLGEGRVLGSSSRATKPATTQTLNEGFEAARWAKLAGITK